MAKATATCTCKHCGKTFTKVKRNCGNRRDANSWEEWAVNAFDECEECYKDRMRREEAAMGLILNVRARFDVRYPEYALFFSGDSFNHKDEIKELGYKWSWSAWEKYAETYEEVEALIEEAKAKFENLKIEISVTENEMAVIAGARKRKEDIQAQKIDELAKNPLPEIPEILKGKKWNERFYGKSDRYRVYLDGKEKYISNSEKLEIELYLQELNEVRDIRKKIRDKYEAM